MSRCEDAPCCGHVECGFGPGVPGYGSMVNGVSYVGESRQLRIVDIEPRYQFVCEHPDDDRGELLTLRTESSERYCLDHFPWHNDDERDHTLAMLRFMLDVRAGGDGECTCWFNKRGELIYVETACPTHKGART